MALANQLRNLINIKRNFWNKDDIGSAGDAAVGRDPSRRASHHFHHDHAIVRFGRGVHAVDRFGCDVHRRVESESEVRAGEIVVNRLRNAYNFHSGVEKFRRHRKRIVAANRNQRFASMFSQVRGAALQAVRILAGIGARSAKDRATARQDAADRREVEFHGLIFQQPAPSFHETHEAVFVVKGPLAYYRPNHRIQSRTVAAARQHSDFHCLSQSDFWLEHESAR